jgi:vacuolar-type H+-ATPase subunit I/STV1
MAARLSPDRPDSADDAADVLRSGYSQHSTTPTRPRVVSVSPHPAGAASSQVPNTAHPDEAAGLSDAVDQVRQLATRLERLIGDGRVQDVQTTKASLQLQERLRLSARMLRAFQAQIDRVEATLKSQQDHERQLRQLQGQVEQQCAAAANVVSQAASQAEDLKTLLDRATRAATLRAHEGRTEPTIDLSVDAPLKFKRYANRAQG